MNFTKSNEWLEKVKQMIPVGSQTYSKGYRYYPVGASPLAIDHGKGSHVWDLDGNEFVDWVCALGPITLGYHYPCVDNAVRQQLKKGAIFSLPSPLELELAEMIAEVTPVTGGRGMVRFLKTGTEACQAAIRAARAYTGKSLILSYSYHGWGSEFAVLTERKKGIPEEYALSIQEFPYDDIVALENLLDENKGNVAAVIMEPVVINAPTIGYLQQVRELTRKHNIVLIFDEIVTGMRWGIPGASSYFHVIPDMILLGKGIANGFPLSAICGNKNIMAEFEEIMVSSTFGGDCISLAAGIATLTEMQKKGTIEHCWKMGKRLIEKLKDDVDITGYSCHPKINLMDESPEAKSLFIEYLISQGHLVVNSLALNICYSHNEKDIDSLANAISWASERLNAAIKGGFVETARRGQLIQPAFRRL